MIQFLLERDNLMVIFRFEPFLVYFGQFLQNEINEFLKNQLDETNGPLVFAL